VIGFVSEPSIPKGEVQLLGERKVVASRRLTMEGAAADQPHLGIIDGVQGNLRETEDGRVLLEHKGGYPSNPGDDCGAMHYPLA
jgi:hypothetical protein